MARRNSWLTLFALVLPVCAHAGDFEQANEHYDAGRYVEARQLYERLVETGTRSANLFHNLANTDYRIGSPGRAMLGYERSLALEPDRPETVANLKLLRDQTHARDLERPLAARLLQRLSADTWTILATLGAWGAVFSLASLCTTPRRSRAGRWCGLLGGLAVAGVSLFSLSLHTRDRALAIVTAREVEAHLAPAESAALAGVLPAGSRVRILSERGVWTYCELPDARRGWLATSAIERVRPTES